MPSPEEHESSVTPRGTSGRSASGQRDWEGLPGSLSRFAQPARHSVRERPHFQCTLGLVVSSALRDFARPPRQEGTVASVRSCRARLCSELLTRSAASQAPAAQAHGQRPQMLSFSLIKNSVVDVDTNRIVTHVLDSGIPCSILYLLSVKLYIHQFLYFLKV